MPLFIKCSFFVDYPLSGAIDIGISHSLYSKAPKENFYMQTSIYQAFSNPRIINCNRINRVGVGLRSIGALDLQQYLIYAILRRLPLFFFNQAKTNS
jgi:hypothetical protein